jgi:hypothetical protein
MTDLVSEFRAIAAAYSKISGELTRTMDADPAQNTETLIQSVLANQQSLARIGQMNAQVLHVCTEWKKRRETADTQSWDEINGLAENALKQAIRLNQLCSRTAQKLASARDKLSAELSEIGKGVQYAKSVATAKSNYPKFIDSMY